MTKIWIAAAAVLIAPALIVFLLYYFGMIDFYHPMKKAAENQIKVACVGDSITFGCTVANWRKNNYPAVLGCLLGEKYCVNNFGYTNRTAIKTADYPYVKEKVYRQSLDFEPDIVLLMLGANDTKVNNWDQGKFINDYCELIHSYQSLASSPKVYVLAPTPLFEVKGKVLWQLQKNTAENQTAPAVKQLAVQTGAKYIDMYRVFEGRKELFSDGVHPNAKGSRLFAETVYAVLRHHRP